LAIPQWIVRKSAVNYVVSPQGSTIILRANNASEAKMIFDNSADEFDTVFTTEDEIDIYIDSVSAANHMMVGFIQSIEDKRKADRSKELVLSIIDWGGYLSGKTIFEKDYIKTKTSSIVFTDAAAEIAGLSTNITGLSSSSEDMKRRFGGTYVKDGFYAAAENSGADFFIDETKTLQAFAHGARDLDESISGLIYKIKDIAPVSTDTLIVDHRKLYTYSRSAEHRYRSVTASDGVRETYPVDIDLYSTAKFKDDELGKTFSAFYTMTFSAFDVDTTTTLPVQHLPSTDVGGGLIMPTIRVLVPTSGQNISILLRGIELTDDGSAKILQDMGLVPTDWQRISFFIRNQLTGTALTDLKVNLIDTAGNFWSRSILTHLNTTNFTYLAYDLPANLVDSPTNGWTKTGSPTVINRVEFDPVPLSGYDAKSFFEFGKLHFFRRRRHTITGSGSPVTEKIIIDSSIKSINSLITLATKEQARSNIVADMGLFTIDGNQAFKKPAFQIQIDFTNTLGAGRSTTTARIEELRHKLLNGRYETEVLFSPSFQRT